MVRGTWDAPVPAKGPPPGRGTAQNTGCCSRRRGRGSRFCYTWIGLQKITPRFATEWAWNTRTWLPVPLSIFLCLRQGTGIIKTTDKQTIKPNKLPKSKFIGTNHFPKLCHSRICFNKNRHTYIILIKTLGCLLHAKIQSAVRVDAQCQAVYYEILGEKQIFDAYITSLSAADAATRTGSFEFHIFYI